MYWHPKSNANRSSVCSFVAAWETERAYVVSNCPAHNVLAPCIERDSLFCVCRYVEAWETERAQQREKESQLRLETAKKRQEEGEVCFVVRCSLV